MKAQTALRSLLSDRLEALNAQDSLITLSDADIRFNAAEREAVLAPHYRTAERLIHKVVLAHVALSVLLAAWYGVWGFSLVVSALAWAAFALARRFHPGTFATRVVSGITLQTFVALHIHQAHGLPEVHFFFFTSVTVMIAYLDLRCMWPGVFLIIAQHALFAYLHSRGAGVYLVEGAPLGAARLVFYCGIALFHTAVCALWSRSSMIRTLRDAQRIHVMREQHLRIEESVAQRVALEQAREVALETSKLKSEFLAMISHEIRTPLNGILGMAEMLMDTPLDEAQLRYARTIAQSGDALLAIINDLLDFSKIEAGKLELEVIEFRLVNLLESQTDVFEGRVREKRLGLRVEVDPAVPARLQGDPGRIGQILLNLLSNAIKFTPEGGAVRLTVQAPVPGRVRFAVIDTGVGLSAEAQKRLFQPFTQVDSSTSRTHGGTGLGLSICKRLVELMHGEIGCESAPGRGSTFWFDVPLEAVEGRLSDSDLKVRRPTGPREEAGRTLSGRPGRRRRVLVAEDNRVNQLVTLQHLERLGYSALAVGNGAEALDAVMGGEYDLVLMDCQMPEVDGYEATRRIRHWEARKHRRRTPIIALTANAMKGDAERCLEAGMDDHLSKPLRRDDLRVILDRWLEPMLVLRSDRLTPSKTPKPGHSLRV